MIKSKIMLSVCSVLAMVPAYSAPSVKKLGGINSYAGTANVVSAKTNSVNSGRSGSVRTLKPVNTVKPATAVKTAKDVNTARLSVGKYLHGAGTAAGIIKPVNVSGSTINNAEFEQLGDQVTVLNNRIDAIENNLDINVIESDENADTTQMVSGIDVDSDGRTLKVSRSGVKIPVGSENSLRKASIWITED